MTTPQGVLLVLLLAPELFTATAGLVDGMRHLASKAVDTAHDAVDSVVDLVQDAVQGVGHFVNNTVRGVSHFVNNTVQGVGHFVNNTVQGVGYLVQNTVKAGKDAVAPDTPCYQPLGCFPMEEPWWSLRRLLPAPQSPEDINTRFYLYTRTQPKRYYLNTRPNVSVDRSDYNATRMTVIITHGYESNGNASWLRNMAEGVLHKIDANVIVVDWGQGASDPSYFQVASNARVVGAEIARVCWYLMNNTRMSSSSLHLIGHSIGAHIMSYVSSYKIKIGRITGLDPAGVMFEGFSKQLLLDSSDAVFVDIIHTDAKPLLPSFGLGVVNPYGHVDFYINNGTNQPNCSDDEGLQTNSITEIAQDVVSCPHSRAYEIWTDSLLNDNCTFLGFRKNESEDSIIEKSSRNILELVTPMGLETAKFPGRGTFYVTTRGKEPYCVEDFKGKQIYATALEQLTLYQKDHG